MESELDLARRAAADMIPRNPQNHYPIGRTEFTFIVQYRYRPHADRWETEDTFATEDEAHAALRDYRETLNAHPYEWRIVARQDTIVHTVSPE